MEISVSPPQGVNPSRLHQELSIALPGVYSHLVCLTPPVLLQVGQAEPSPTTTNGVSAFVYLVDTATPADIATLNVAVTAHNPALLSTAQTNHANAVTQRAALRAEFAADYARLNTPLASNATNTQVIADYNQTRTMLAKLLVALNDLLLN